MKTTKQLINNLVGQLNGINRMIEKEEDCFKVLIQMKAVKAGVGKVMNSFSEEQFLTCLKNAKQNDKDKIQKLLKEIINN